ncbi:MAG: hypothetical protein OHK0028_11330 [Deltaproteobacteria bacterium]
MTFGGGMTIENGSPGRDGSAWNDPAAIHAAYHRSSAAFGSYGWSFSGSFSLIGDGTPWTEMGSGRTVVRLRGKVSRPACGSGRSPRG